MAILMLVGLLLWFAGFIAFWVVDLIKNWRRGGAVSKAFSIRRLWMITGSLLFFSGASGIMYLAGVASAVSGGGGAGISGPDIMGFLEFLCELLFKVSMWSAFFTVLVMICIEGPGKG
ncbi:MAG: hypothetical protein JWP80_1045 [Pseudomonas sp.]|nr:hypothetical protein [Pseudomonas sp.]